MGLSDADVQKQIKHMLAFIEQEASEKVEEIDAKVILNAFINCILNVRLKKNSTLKRVDWCSSKELRLWNIIRKKRNLLNYNGKCKFIICTHINVCYSQNSNFTSQSKIKVLKAKEEHMQHVLQEADQNLSRIVKSGDKYQGLLRELILQALFELLEPEAVLRCKKSDLNLVKPLVEECADIYQQTTGKPVSIIIDTNNFLPEDTIGGIILSNTDDKIKVINTMNSRLQQAYQQLIPEIKETLFGKNPNRKFYD